MALKLERFPVVARFIDRVITERIPEIRRQEREAVVQDITRAMTSQSQLTPMIPESYPNKSGSPFPLYGYDRPIWYSTPIAPRRRPESLIDVETMRRFSNTYDVLRSCINHLKREVQAQQFAIVSRDEDDDSASTARDVVNASAFFTKAGGLGEINETRRHYEAKMVEDTMVIGAFSSWKNWSKGGELIQVLNIDAGTIRPRMDAYGWPGPGEDWYEQWIMGMLITAFKPEELVYDGLWPVTTGPFFVSAVEWLIGTTISALKSDEWNRSWLTDGNTPGQTYVAPSEWTPQQVAEYADIFDLMLAGDISKRQKSVWVPAGAKAQEHSRKDQDFSVFDLWLARRTGAICGVQLASIGFAGEQYKVSQEKSTDSTTQFGAGSLLDLRKEHYDDILIDLGYPHLEVRNGVSAEETPIERTTRLTMAIGGGLMTPNQAIKENGGEPVDGGDTLLVPTLVQSLDNAIAKPEPAVAPVQDPSLAPESKQPDAATKKANSANPDSKTKSVDTEKKPTDTPANSDGEPTGKVERTEDLAAWERKAIKRLKEGRNPSSAFESDALSKGQIARIAGSLRLCADTGAIRAVFRAEGELSDESEDD